MVVEKTIKYLKKNGIFFVQLGVLVLILVVLFEYIATNESSTIEMVSIQGDMPAAPPPKATQSGETKKETKAPSPVTFEIDEVSREMLDSSAKNPQEMLSADTPCSRFDNVHAVFRRNGTISKARNVEQFKKPLPAMITEIQYTCIDKITGEPQTKATTMGVAVDAQENVLRCVQSTSDQTLSSEARFKHVLNMMTHHCGFKLIEHRTTGAGQ